MKIKNIRFDDIRGDNVLRGDAKIVGESSAHGRSYYTVECPFCLGDFIAYKWSLRGGGKRCPHCLAIMGSNFQAYQWTELVIKS